MVEVIKHGEKNVIDCDFCGAQLKYTAVDIKEKEYYFTPFDSEFIKYIICPDCNHHVALNKMYKGVV